MGDERMILGTSAGGSLAVWRESTLSGTSTGTGSGTHPDLAAHEAMGLADSGHAHHEYATDADLTAHAGTAHGLSSHAIDGAYHSGVTVLPSSGEKNALAGTSGTPGTNNKYVTNADARLSDARTPATHTHAEADVTSLVSDLAGKAASGHTHTGTYAAASHTHAVGDLPTGTSGTTVALGNHTHAASGGEAFPVGSVFLSAVATNPATLLGYGTWTEISRGRFLVGEDAGTYVAGQTGGAATHGHSFIQPTAAGESAHTHTYTQTVNHVHVQTVNSATTGGLSGYTPDTSSNTPAVSGYSTQNPTGGVATGTTAAGSSHTHTMSGGAVADGANVPPWLAVYIWQRTA